MSTLYAENYDEYVKENRGFATKLPVTLSGTAATLTVGGAATFTGNLTVGGSISQTGVVPTVFHSGGVQPTSATAATSGATNASVVTTQTYSCEVFIPANTTLTGISVLNGTAVSGHISVGLADNTGTVVAHSATNVSQSGTTAYQQVPFTTTYAATGPNKYFILLQGDATTARFISHTIGNFGAVAVTSETYGTFLTSAAYSTSTFTTAVGPICDTY